MTAALNAVGGIPSYSRAMILALEQIGDVRVVDLKLSGNRRDQLFGFLRTLLVLLRDRPQLLVLGHVGFGPIGLLWRCFGRRFVVVVYGAEVWGPASRLGRATLRGADSIWPISDFTANEVLRLAPQATLGPILGGNIEDRFFQPHASTPGPFRALLVSRIEDLRYKGVDSAIDAVQLVAASPEVERAVELRIAGTGPAVVELSAMVRDKDKAGVVRCLGYVSEEELLAEYRAADVVILVSRHRRGVDPRGEGLGLVVLEGAASGATSIASVVGGTGDIVVDGETGFLIDPTDPVELADRIVDLVVDPDRCRSMGEAARDLASNGHRFVGFAERVKTGVEQVAPKSRTFPVGEVDKLALHINALGAVMGGAQRHLGAFVAALVEQRPDWSVTVWVNEGAQTGMAEGVKVEEVPIRGHRARLWWENVGLAKALATGGADVLVNLTNSGPLRPPVPSVLYQRNALYFDPAWLSRCSARERCEAFARRVLIRAQLRASAYSIVPSTAMADYVTRGRGKLGSCNLRVVPHGVDLDRFTFSRWNPPSLPRLELCHVSHAAPHKDQLLLVELVALLVSRGLDPHLKLTIARSDSPTYVDSFAARARELNVVERIELLGYVPDVESLLHESDVMVFPSLSESFGFPVAEAMACGTPVLASDIAASRELLGPAGWYFPPGDVGAAADVLESLIAEDPAMVRKVLDDANAHVRSLTWAANAAAVIKVIEAAVTRG